MGADLRKVREVFGQSLWLDNLSRTLLHDGILARYIAEDGITGVTSNPSIFQKAIHSSPLYRDGSARGESAERLYEDLVRADLQMACDLLRPVYEQTDGDDGWVSWEESPALAMDEAAAVAEAGRLRSIVNRDNLLIKVPATAPGIAALRTLTAGGVSVNLTLMFGLGHVRAAFAAYQEGLASWIGRGGDPRKVKSVASLFLSRVDTLVDRRLGAVGSEEALALRGKTAVALAKEAYAIYRETFHGPGFAGLRAQGGRPQHLLWASTGTKNPDYSDLLYVEPLIGPETVNTLPDATVDRFRDHGNLASTLGTGLAEARETLERVSRLGIDLEGDIAPALQQEGLEAFARSFQEMLAEVEELRRQNPTML